MFIVSLMFYLSFAAITLTFINNAYTFCTSTGQAFPFKRKLYYLLSYSSLKQEMTDHSLKQSKKDGKDQENNTIKYHT